MELTSLHYARLIMWLAYNRKQIVLNKTQLQKILFVCYGLYIVGHNGSVNNIHRKLFYDDTPKAWPFGPVFPRSYKRYYNTPTLLSDQEKEAFSEDKNTLFQIIKVTDNMCLLSARDLTKWSHQEGTPWSKTLFSEKGKLKWNAVIDDKYIYEYFNGSEWWIGLTD